MTSSTPFAFMLISPDAVARHAHAGIVDRMRSEGFYSCGHKVVQAGPAELDALYALHIDAVWDTYRYRLVDQLFGFGPSLVVLWLSEDEGEERHRRIAALKGATDPTLAAPGTMRHDFGGINSILGLLHSSDNPAESQREAAIFFTESELAEASRRASDRSALADTERSLDETCRMLSYQPVEMRDLAGVLRAIRARILLAVAGEHDLPLTPLSGSDPTDDEHIGRVGTWLSDSGVGDGLVAALRYDPRDGDEESWNRFRRALAAYELRLDDWEDLVLGTTRHFPPGPVDSESP